MEAARAAGLRRRRRGDDAVARRSRSRSSARTGRRSSGSAACAVSGLPADGARRAGRRPGASLPLDDWLPSGLGLDRPHPGAGLVLRHVPVASHVAVLAADRDEHRVLVAHVAELAHGLGSTRASPPGRGGGPSRRRRLDLELAAVHEVELLLLVVEVLARLDARGQHDRVHAEGGHAERRTDLAKAVALAKRSEVPDRVALALHHIHDLGAHVPSRLAVSSCVMLPAGGRGDERSGRGLGLLALALGLAQLDPPDLAGEGLRQVVDELDLARIGVGRVALAHVRLDLVGELVGGLVPVREHDEGLDDVPRRSSGEATAAASITAGCSTHADSTSNGPIR